MNNSIKSTSITTFFDGKVQIDELKSFSDDRGYVCELWRTDDSHMNSSYIEDNDITLNQNINKNSDTSPQMCYFSETGPLIMRGPHEHTDQTDWFITIASKMLYIFVDKNEKTEHFITDPDKIYRVRVDPGIVHSYRNLSIEKNAITANFPSSLFMGVDKKEEIDEIRHEPIIEDNRNVYILGANGRLGRAVTKEFLDNMGMHEYNVIPIDQKFTKDGMDMVNEFLNDILDEDIRTENDILINCIGKTNVQSSDENFLFANFQLPKYLTEFSIRHKFHFIHFSTDYIYQTGKVTEYTQSKMKYEDWLETFYTEGNLIGKNIQTLQTYVHVIRLANLFSIDVNDTHNALNKLWNAYNNNALNIQENVLIMPTSVEDISKFLIKEYIFNMDKFEQFTNLSGKPYTIEYILETLFGCENVDYHYVDTPSVINNPKAFLNRRCYVGLDCDENILKKVDTIKNE